MTKFINLLINLLSENIITLPSLPEEVESFNCSFNKLNNLIGSPNYIAGFFECSYNKLTDLKGAPNYVGGWFNCSNNILNGSPNEAHGFFDCSYNNLMDLTGAPSEVKKSFDCHSNRRLTSLFGVPKRINGSFDIRCNPNLLDISNIWDSDIGGVIWLDINPGMAILPLINFKPIFGIADVNINEIHKRNQGSSKQNIIDFQYENGFEENARWKPLNNL